jgi:hypothetical protein
MDPPDDNIQFDFFEEEPPTAESAPKPKSRLPHRPQRRPRGPARPPGSRPVVRLGIFTGLIVFLLLVFSLLIASCAGESTHDLYSNYVNKVDTIATQSNTDGAHTVAAFTTPGLSVAQIEGKLNTIASQEQQNVDAAQSLSPPGKLRTEHANLIQSLQLRVSGVEGLAKALSDSKGTSASALALILTQETYALLASDVMWDDLFRVPAQNVIDDAGVHQVTVPSSHFLAAPDLIITQHAWTQIMQRINGSGSGGSSGSTCGSGIYGTNISQVAALPNGAGGKVEVLNSGLNTVTTSQSLQLQVTIFNGGDSQEVQIPVTLTVPQSQGGPITRTEKVQLIDAGHYATVTFNDLGEPPFDTTATLRVDVARVPCETNIGNNSGSYKVLFTLPS